LRAHYFAGHYIRTNVIKHLFDFSKCQPKFKRHLSASSQHFNAKSLKMLGVKELLAGGAEGIAITKSIVEWRSGTTFGAQTVASSWTTWPWTFDVREVHN